MRVLEKPDAVARIGIVGKYVDLAESYKSLSEALTHGGLANRAAVEVVYVDAEEIVARGAKALLSELDAVLVPGGFGERVRNKDRSGKFQYCQDHRDRERADNREFDDGQASLPSRQRG